MYTLHAPTVCVIVLYYSPRWIPLVYNIPRSWRVLGKTVANALVADVVTIPVYFFMRHVASIIPLWIGFCITILLLCVSCLVPARKGALGMKGFLVLGAAQGVAALPGISRLAIVYTAGKLLGLSGKKAFDCAWLVQMPLITGAFVVGGMVLIMNGQLAALSTPTMGVVVVSGMLLSLAGIAFMDYLAQKNAMWVMGLYLVVPLMLSYLYRHSIALL